MRRRGFDVIEASDGDEAIRQVLENRPDLVILDVMMPGQSGWEVCRSIRETESLKDTGVIMLTGVGERMNEMTSPLYGADASLDKPFEFEALDELVTQVLEKRGPKKTG
jgi:DNA-binding response OmpR family regulator